MYTVKKATRREEFERILGLRYKILRQPWQQSRESATDELEAACVNLYIEDETNGVIACGRLQENPGKCGQIRFMAVEEGYQGRGLGKQIVVQLEEEARQLGLVMIELQARENAVEFYRGCGYLMKAETFKLWGIIQHYLMEKRLVSE